MPDPDPATSEASATTTADCSTTYRTKFVRITNDSGWNLVVAFLRLVQEHDLPPPPGYLQDHLSFPICQNRPPHSVCDTDPCPLMGAPIVATRAQCTAKVELNGVEKDINFQDYTTPVGKYIGDCGWGVSSKMLDEASEKGFRSPQTATAKEEDFKSSRRH